MSSISESSFQDFGQPISVGMVSTEGEKLLNALRKIQFKLKDKPQRHERSVEKSVLSGHSLSKSRATEEHKCCTVCSSGDHHFPKDNRLINKSHKCPEPVICGYKPSEDLSNQLIETRLKLIETQLQNISMQLMANNCVKKEINGPKHMDKTLDPKVDLKTSPPKTVTRISTIEDETGSDDKYEASIEAIKQLMRSADSRKISKSVSLDAINHRNIPSKHFHLQYRDIPFILGTNSSKSHSVIANRQIEISRLKQHNQLCTNRVPNRQIFSKTLKTQVLDNEIKDLLYDLHEEHNYICEEIQYLSKQLETISDPKRRVEFNRELYFLSRRILAKKRQINELQELHSIVRNNALKESNQRVDTNPKAIVKREVNQRSNVRNKYETKHSIPKWF